MKILLDVDGVLANFVQGACRLHGHTDPYTKEKNLGNYSIQDLLGIQGPAFWDMMDEHFWFTLKKMPLADKIVEYLENRFGQESICLLTSPIRHRGCHRGKMRWIEKYYPQYSRQNLIGKPKHFCAGPDASLIDDFENNVAKFSAHGGHAFLMPAPWNRKYFEHPFDALKNYMENL